MSTAALRFSQHDPAIRDGAAFPFRVDNQRVDVALGDFGVVHDHRRHAENRLDHRVDVPLRLAAIAVQHLERLDFPHHFTERKIKLQDQRPSFLDTIVHNSPFLFRE